MTLAESDDHPTAIGGLTLSIARKVLTMVIELLEGQDWRCGCTPDHAAEQPCELRERLASDLSTLS